MIRGLVGVALLLSSLLLAGPAATAAEQGPPVVDRLQDRYGTIDAIEADFTQEFHSAMGGVQTSSGRVYMKKPGRMRWNYTFPVQDEIVSDGRSIWVYQPDLNQVIVRPVDEAATSIATDFLSGIGQIKKDFYAEVTGDNSDSWLLSLTPRQTQPNLKSLLIEVDKKSMLATRTVVIDHFGNETHVGFRGFKLNESMPSSLFDYKPPEGASIIRP